MQRIEKTKWLKLKSKRKFQNGVLVEKHFQDGSGKNLKLQNLMIAEYHRIKNLSDIYIHHLVGSFMKVTEEMCSLYFTML